MIFYAPKIFEEAGFASASGALIATLGIGGINVFATIIAVWLLDKVGRRALLLIGTAGMSISLGLLSFAFFTQSKMIGNISIASLMPCSFFCDWAGAVTSVILSEIYPFKIRGQAMTIAVFTNWL